MILIVLRNERLNKKEELNLQIEIKGEANCNQKKDIGVSTFEHQGRE